MGRNRAAHGTVRFPGMQAILEPAFSQRKLRETGTQHLRLQSGDHPQFQSRKAGSVRKPPAIRKREQFCSARRMAAPAVFLIDFTGLFHHIRQQSVQQAGFPDA